MQINRKKQVCMQDNKKIYGILWIFFYSWKLKEGKYLFNKCDLKNRLDCFNNISIVKLFFF